MTLWRKWHAELTIGWERQIVEDPVVHRRQLIELKVPDYKHTCIIVKIDKYTFEEERRERSSSELVYMGQLLHSA